MELYNFVELTAERAEVNLTHGGKEKLVGALRAAGFDTLETPSDRRVAFRIVSERIASIVETPRLRKRLVVAAAEKGGATEFDAIKDMKNKGVCPKCKTDKHTSTPKIRNGEKVLYCGSCRATLWLDG